MLPPSAASGLDVRLATLVPSGVIVPLMLGHLPWGWPTQGHPGEYLRAQRSGLCLGREWTPGRQGYSLEPSFSLSSWCQFPAGRACHPPLDPGQPLGPWRTAWLNLLSPGPLCWLCMDFLPEHKQGIQSPDTPSQAFFLVKSPFPPGREHKNQFPGFPSLESWWGLPGLCRKVT